MGNHTPPVKVLVLAGKYRGDYPLLNGMVLGLDQDAYEAKVCYLKGRPDGGNSLDGLGRAVYLEDGGTPGKSLVRLLKKERPRILHCHRHGPTVYGVVAGAIAGVGHVISHVHGLGRTRNFKRRLANFFILKRVDRILTVSNTVREDVLKTNWGLPPSKVITVLNGIDAEGIAFGPAARERARLKMGVGSKEFVLGTVGRMTETKGQRHLLSAFAEVAGKIPGLRLVVAGEGPDAGSLKELAEGLGISGKVAFLGFRSDVRELLSGLDVFVFPSLAEGLPLALLEAMAAGLPVVASSVGGIPEVFGGCDMGRLVPAKDPQALAVAIMEIYSLGEEGRNRMGQAAKGRVFEAFTHKTMCRSLTDVYRSVLGA
ncbi:MAG: glycosyltransferase [Deltaproteobacteria bacterium]|nr:glycosyltransferase [Deltaproteobacteria bacterium]